MKILHIINSLNTGGAEKLLVETLPLYEKKNIEVDLLLLSKKETPFENLLNNTFKGSVYHSNIKHLYSPLQIFQIIKHIRKKKYDIVHAHLFPTLYWLSLAKLFFRFKTLILFTEHNTHNKRLGSAVFRWIDKIIYHQYSKIIAITPQVKEVLIQKLNIKENKIKVVYNGVDINKYKNAKVYNKEDFFDKDSIMLIQVSRFHPQKDQKTLIKTLALLPNTYKLLLVGNGDTQEECKQLVQSLSLQERVQFLGNRTDIPSLLKTADIAVQSSHWEGFGLTAVEAMAAGKPIIASNVIGLKDIVSDYGLIFEKGNENDLLQKIQSLANKDYYEQISEKCSRRAEDFQLTIMVEKTVALYQKLTNSIK